VLVEREEAGLGEREDMEVEDGREDESPIEQVVPRRRATSRQGNIVVRPIYVCLIF
jgi:hypothetical protein